MLVDANTVDLDAISDEDFDILTDVTLDLIGECLSSQDESMKASVRQQVVTKMNSPRFDLSFELNTPTSVWWEENVLPEIDAELVEQDNLAGDEVGTAVDGAEGKSSLEHVVLELNLRATDTSAAHQGESVILASVYFVTTMPLKDFSLEKLNFPAINWLPELDQLS